MHCQWRSFLVNASFELNFASTLGLNGKTEFDLSSQSDQYRLLRWLAYKLVGLSVGKDQDRRNSVKLFYQNCCTRWPTCKVYHCRCNGCSCTDRDRPSIEVQLFQVKCFLIGHRWGHSVDYGRFGWQCEVVCYHWFHESKYRLLKRDQNLNSSHNKMLLFALFFSCQLIDEIFSG